MNSPDQTGRAAVREDSVKRDDETRELPRLLRMTDPAAAPRGARTLASLPPMARVYVGIVCVAAAIVLARAIADIGPTPRLQLSVLMLLSLAASMIKVEIPIAGHASTLTACHVIDLIALIMFGTNAAVVVSAWGGWTQCTFRSRVPNPRHQTAFSIATLALTTWTAGLVFTWMNGSSAGPASVTRWDALGAASMVFFLLNSGLVAGAVALTTSQRLRTIWFDFFFSSWPSYVIGAVLAAAIVAGIQHESYWLVPPLVAALALLHRNHRAVVERVNDSMSDPLTGLYNQRFLTEHVTRELARARRNHTSVAIAVLDLDDFKGINDRRGHAAGDIALQRVAHALKQVVRGSDVCGRHGGDEFVLVMTDCSAADARRRIQEVQLAVAAAGFDAEHSFGTPLRMSAGVAVFPDDGHRFETLFAAADSRMYAIKHKLRVKWH